MINIKELKLIDVGRGVRYLGYNIEVGIITSWNEKNIFVRYISLDKNKISYTSQATKPQDLEFATDRIFPKYNKKESK